MEEIQSSLKGALNCLEKIVLNERLKLVNMLERAESRALPVLGRQFDREDKDWKLV